MAEETVMKGVTEYCEGMDVCLIEISGQTRLAVKAYNEAGFNSTQVDVLELIDWLKTHRPDLLACVA
jgi:hypothetical protein